MSFNYDFSFGPVTPPDFSLEESLYENSYTSVHSRSSSVNTSCWSQEPYPETVNTYLSTPVKSPVRQNGTLLLPKIRSQDQNIDSEPQKIKKIPQARQRRPLAAPFRPSHTRSYTNPECASIVLPDISSPSPNHSTTSLYSPNAATINSHQRRASNSSLDGQTLGRYGFPTYRQLPTYTTNNQRQTLSPPASVHAMPREPSPMRNEISFDDFSYMDDMAFTPPAQQDPPTTSLLSYLSSPNPAPALVAHLNTSIRDPTAKHFWWDIRQIRSWTSFSLEAITSTPSLFSLLTIPLPNDTLPLPSRTTGQPDNEAALASTYANFYATKLNAALSLSQGERHLSMRASSSPNFVSAYTDDQSALIYGRGFGRVVGLVKSFNTWNTGMRVEGNHKKVQYLRGLAHLHGTMREHGCRYGFIMTEIELVVVRNGTENTPYFGYLELQTIQLATHASEESEEAPQLTALLALYYLHLLARDEPLMNQPSWKTAIGAPAEGTRRKCLKKDTWIPEPQLVEKREAKRGRGWVWCEEAVGRKELGKRGVRYAGK